jgi:endonuclease/exonuclease/phosphatase family metal-dependent hydrolase
MMTNTKNTAFVRPLRALFFSFFLVFLLASLAIADTLRIATWNVSDYVNGDARRANFQTAIYGVNAANSLSMSPDVFIGQEFRDAGAITHFLGTLNGASGSPGDWAAAPFVEISPLDNLNNAFFYRTSKVDFLSQRIINATVGADPFQPRDTLRHDIQIKGTTDVIGIYNTHMKSSAGGSENTRRQAEADYIRNNAQGINTNGAGSGLPSTYHYLVAGDFNMKGSTEQPFQTLTSATYESSTAGRFVDPIAATGSWSTSGTTNNRILTNDGAMGLNDRFDMLLLSPSLTDANGTAYVNRSGVLQSPTTYSTSTWNDPNHSYRVWGNDGTQAFGAAVNTTNNQMTGNAIAQAIVNTGAQHIPVFLELGFTSAAIPEPGTLGLVGLGLGMGIVRVRVRLRRRVVSPATRPE